MEEDEGTVVYYGTSPALEKLIPEQQSLSDELAFTEKDRDQSLEEEKGENESIPPSQRDEKEKSPTKWLLLLMTQSLGQHLGFPPNHTHLVYQCSQDVAMTIRDSPLLTEDDYQMLYFVLLKPHPLIHMTSTSKQLSSNYARVSSVLAILLVAVLAVCWMDHMTLLVYLLVVVAVLVSVSGVVEQVILRIKERELSRVRQTVSDYCRETESLLSLLSHTLKTIRETELVNRQFTRTVRGSVKHGSFTHYQCPGLRRCLYSVCQTVVRELENATIHFSQLHPLNKELDISPPLSSSHNNLSANLDDISREQDRENECLSQESLKDAANLLAVLNSALLRHIALCLVSPPSQPLPPPPATPSSTSDRTTSINRDDVEASTHTLLNSTAKILSRVRVQVMECRQRLEWNCDLHRNHLLGECPDRPSDSRVEVSSDETTVTQLARDVHCIDIRTQSALQRIRDLGKIMNSKNKESITLQDCRDQLSVIQRMIDSVADRLDDSIVLIDNHLSPSTSHNGEQKEEKSDEEEEAAGNVVPEATSAQKNRRSSCSSSEDEKVFEGYVCAVEEEENGVKTRGETEEDEMRKKERELDARMVRELEDVLAVRSERRAQEREERRRKRRKRRKLSEDQEETNTGPQEDHSAIHRVFPVITEESDSHQALLETKDVILKKPTLKFSSNQPTPSSTHDPLCSLEIRNEEKMKEVAELEKEEGAEKDKKDGEVATHDWPSESTAFLSPDQRQLALRVAAIATSRRGNRVEETFGSVDENSESEYI